jgi:hypothetical protein
MRNTIGTNFARSKGLSVPAEGDSILSWSLGRTLTGPLRLGRRAPRNGEDRHFITPRNQKRFPTPLFFPKGWDVARLERADQKRLPIPLFLCPLQCRRGGEVIPPNTWRSRWPAAPNNSRSPGPDGLNCWSARLIKAPTNKFFQSMRPSRVEASIK